MLESAEMEIVVKDEVLKFKDLNVGEVFYSKHKAYYMKIDVLNRKVEAVDMNAIRMCDGLPMFMLANEEINLPSKCELIVTLPLL